MDNHDEEILLDEETEQFAYMLSLLLKTVNPNIKRGHVYDIMCHMMHHMTLGEVMPEDMQGYGLEVLETVHLSDTTH